MRKCRNLNVVILATGEYFGKCHYMDTPSEVFFRIKNEVEELDSRGNVIPCGECPFFNRDMDQVLCPGYS